MSILLTLCDDNEAHLKYTEKLLRQTLGNRDADIDCFQQPEKLLFAVENDGYAPQIAVLDMEMGSMDGIELAQRLNALLPGCCIIFLTGYHEYVSKAYRADHIFFILKDKADEYMGEALERALLRLRHEPEEYVRLSAKGKTVLLLPKEIVYVESSRRKLSVHTRDACHEVYGRLHSLLSEEQGRDFFRCHQSFLVNLSFVLGLVDGCFLLSTGERIPVSRGKLAEARQRFFAYVGLGGN